MALAAIAAADPHPNATMTAIGDRFPTAPGGWSSTASVPFSSARKWSAVSFGEHGSWFVGGADVSDRRRATQRATASPMPPAKAPGCWSWPGPTACRRTASSHRPSVPRRS